MMADIDESESKPKILVIGGDEYFVEWLNKQKGLSFVFSNLDSDFKDCQGTLFYSSIPLSEEDLFGTRPFEEEIDRFEENVSRLSGIEGVVLYVWFDEDDWREEMVVKRLRLEERGCVWGFGAGLLRIIGPIMDEFFNDNIQTNLKPAKREK